MMNKLFNDFHSCHQDDDFTRILAKILEHLNHMHPFREGNRRTQKEIIRVLSLEKGYKFELDLANEMHYKLYMEGTVHGDEVLLNRLMKLLILFLVLVQQLF